MSTKAQSNRSNGVVRIFGKPGSALGYMIRDFLHRSDIPYEWIELDSDEEARAQAGASGLNVSVGIRARAGRRKLGLRDSAGYLMTGLDLLPGNGRPKGWPLDRDPFYLETSMPGVLAAGNVRHGSIKRCASAVGEGAMAVAFVHRYLAGG